MQIPTFRPLQWNLILHRRACAILASILSGMVCAPWTFAQPPQPPSYTWDQIRDKFESTNPTLKAFQLSIDESKATEITAYLRPNPDFSFTADGTQLVPSGGIYRP